jgi:hypothetical protein
MTIARIAIDTAMLAALVGVEGKTQTDIGALHGIDDRLGMLDPYLGFWRHDQRLVQAFDMFGHDTTFQEPVSRLHLRTSSLEIFLFHV